MAIFEDSFVHKGETLYVRMELLTLYNENYWTQYKIHSGKIANSSSRGILSTILFLAQKGKPFPYEEVKEVTGFTEVEYKDFIEKAAQYDSKIIGLIEKNSAGSNFMSTSSGENNYIVYITNNKTFNSTFVEKVNEDINLKMYMEIYQHIVISVGSDFSKVDSYHNRGIFRNPLHCLNDKYSGLSMMLHGFTGVIATKYFPSKVTMEVRPIGSMQVIIQKHLLLGEGYTELMEGNKKDILDVEFKKDDPERGWNYINTDALVRIYTLHKSKV
jgi:hypothetical protein